MSPIGTGLVDDQGAGHEGDLDEARATPPVHKSFVGRGGIVRLRHLGGVTLAVVSSAAALAGCGSESPAASPPPAATAQTYGIISASNPGCGQQGQELAAYLATGEPTSDDATYGSERQTAPTFQGAAQALYVRREADEYIQQCDQSPADRSSAQDDIRSAADLEEQYFTNNQEYSPEALAQPGFVPSSNDQIVIAVDAANGYCIVASDSATSSYYLYDSQAGGLNSTDFPSLVTAEAGCSIAAAEWTVASE